MYKRLLVISIFIAITFSGPFALTVNVSAASASACVENSSGFLGFPTWYKYLKPKFVPAQPPMPAQCKIEFPNNDFMQAAGPILLAVFEIILRVSALLAIAFILWGGIQYQISQGEPDRVNKARSVLLNAVIGLAITISATVIVNLVGRNLL